MIKGNIENIERMMWDFNSIKDSFDWHDTPQGYDYWNKVLNNLEIVFDKMQPKICSKCGQEIEK